MVFNKFEVYSIIRAHLVEKLDVPEDKIGKGQVYDNEYHIAIDTNSTGGWQKGPYRTKPKTESK